MDGRLTEDVCGGGITGRLMGLGGLLGLSAVDVDATGSAGLLG